MSEWISGRLGTLIHTDIVCSECGEPKEHRVLKCGSIVCCHICATLRTNGAVHRHAPRVGAESDFGARLEDGCSMLSQAEDEDE